MIFGFFNHEQRLKISNVTKSLIKSLLISKIMFYITHYKKITGDNLMNNITHEINQIVLNSEFCQVCHAISKNIFNSQYSNLSYSMTPVKK